MYLSEWVSYFESMDKEDSQGKRVLTEDQANIFRDVIANYKNRKYALLDARSGLKFGSL